MSVGGVGRDQRIESVEEAASASQSEATQAAAPASGGRTAGQGALQARLAATQGAAARAELADLVAQGPDAFAAGLDDWQQRNFGRIIPGSEKAKEAIQALNTAGWSPDERIASAAADRIISLVNSPNLAGASDRLLYSSETFEHMIGDGKKTTSAQVDAWLAKERRAGLDGQTAAIVLQLEAPKVPENVGFHMLDLAAKCRADGTKPTDIPAGPVNDRYGFAGWHTSKITLPHAGTPQDLWVVRGRRPGDTTDQIIRLERDPSSDTGKRITVGDDKHPQRPITPREWHELADVIQNELGRSDLDYQTVTQVRDALVDVPGEGGIETIP